MHKSNKLTTAALIITILTVGSKPLGLIREVLIASKFGSGPDTDAYFVAMTATWMITGFLSNAIHTTLIPILSEIESKEGKTGKVGHSNNMINIIFMISIILVVIGFITAPIMVKLLAKGFKGDQFKLTVQLTRLGLPMILFAGIRGVITGYLHSEQKFTSTAAAGFPFNFVYIFFLLFLSTKSGVQGLMITSVLAVASQFLIQIPEVKSSGFKYKFKFDLKDKYMVKIIYLIFPVIMGVAINDLNVIIDRTLASSLVSGSISALNYANRLNSLVLGVFISAITTIIFPLLSKEANNENINGLKETMGRGINFILIITVPAAVGLMVLAAPIVEVVFQRGEFDVIATLMTAKALIFYSIGLVAMALQLLLIRVYYSLQDTKTPMIISAISVIFNIIFNIVLVKFMYHSGLALATSIATSLGTFLLMYILKKKIGSLGTKAYITTFLKTGLASGIMGLVSYFTYQNLYSILGISKFYNLISLIMAIGVGGGLYLMLCYYFGVDEIIIIINKVKEKVIK